MAEHSLGSRLDALAARMFAKSAGSRLDRLVEILIRKSWCEQTARPDSDPSWSRLRPERGQDDVSAYHLARYVYDGRVTRMRMVDGTQRYVVWANSGEGTRTVDPCRNDIGYRQAERVFTIEEFLMLHQGGTRFDDRIMIMHQRFLASLAELEEVEDAKFTDIGTLVDLVLGAQ